MPTKLILTGFTTVYEEKVEKKVEFQMTVNFHFLFVKVFPLKYRLLHSFG